MCYVHGVGALRIVPGGIRGRVQILVGRGVDVLDELVRVEEAELGAGPPPLDVLLQRDAVREDLVDQRRVLQDLLLVLRRVVRQLVGPAGHVA